MLILCIILLFSFFFLELILRKVFAVFRKLAVWAYESIKISIGILLVIIGVALQDGNLKIDSNGHLKANPKNVTSKNMVKIEPYKKPITNKPVAN